MIGIFTKMYVNFNVNVLQASLRAGRRLCDRSQCQAPQVRNEDISGKQLTYTIK